MRIARKRLVEKVAQQHINDYFCQRMEKLLIIQNGATDLLRLETDEILCVRSDGNYCIMKLSNGEEVQLWMNLLDITRCIDRQLREVKSVFVRTGRQYILNIDYIFDIDTKRDQLTLWRKDIHPIVINEISHEALTRLATELKKVK